MYRNTPAATQQNTIAKIMDKLVGNNLPINLADIWPVNPKNTREAKPLKPSILRLKFTNIPIETAIISKTIVNLLIIFFLFTKIKAITDKNAAVLKIKIEDTKYFDV
jgi:hypothetical protein